MVSQQKLLDYLEEGNVWLTGCLANVGKAVLLAIELGGRGKLGVLGALEPLCKSFAGLKEADGSDLSPIEPFAFPLV